MNSIRSMIIRLVACIAVGVLLAACAVPAIPSNGVGTALPSGAIPDMPVKPKPVEETFHGCPPDGDGSDRELNMLKNRIDEGAYVPVSLQSILNLTWPKTIERKQRANWPTADTNAVGRYEGIPVV